MRDFNFATIIVLIFFGIPVFVVVATSWFLLDQFIFVQRAPTAFVQGTIVNVTPIIGGGSCYSDSSPCSIGDPIGNCDAQARFSTNQKQTIETSGSCYGLPGDKVGIAYHIDNPHEARIVPLNGLLIGNWLAYVRLIVCLPIALAAFVLLLMAVFDHLSEWRSTMARRLW